MKVPILKEGDAVTHKDYPDTNMTVLEMSDDQQLCKVRIGHERVDIFPTVELMFVGGTAIGRQYTRG